MTYNGIPIKTTAVFPPIPTRECDWQATLGDYDEGARIEEGESPEIAAANLIQALWEAGE